MGIKSQCKPKSGVVYGTPANAIAKSSVVRKSSQLCFGAVGAVLPDELLLDG